MGSLLGEATGQPPVSPLLSPANVYRRKSPGKSARRLYAGSGSSDGLGGGGGEGGAPAGIPITVPADVSPLSSVGGKDKRTGPG
jgi:hypothetical protein